MQEDKEMRLRFPPSPTGKIHVGNIRTALFNWLWARKKGGKLILRIEDTDTERSTREFEEIIFKELNWLGMDVDEGPNRGGDYGPYRQSERLEIYQQQLDKLLREGKAYKCYCSKEELEEMRQRQKEAGEIPHYDGRCRNLDPAEAPEDADYVLRFKMPETSEEIVVRDLIRGEVSFSSEDFDDFVIQKSDGMPTYNFAVVVDDALMEISQVIRGEDHLSNTPKQVKIYQALDFSVPDFAHLPLILDEDRAKLKKRSDEQAVYIGEFREMGYLPEALFNFLALLGWSPEDEQEIMSREELVEKFDISRVNKSGAVFDREKLNWMNNAYLKEADLDRLLELTLPHLKEAGYLEEFGWLMESGRFSEEMEPDRDWLKEVIDLGREGISCLAELPTEVELFFTDLEQEDPEAAAQDFQDPEVREVFQRLKDELARIASESDYSEESINQVFQKVRKETGVGGRKFYHPLRLALTGQGSGPDLIKVAWLLGQKEACRRLELALEQGE